MARCNGRERKTDHHESTFYLSNVDGWIQTLANIHHYVHFRYLEYTRINYAPAIGGHFGITSVCQSVRLSVSWRSCLGYRHVGCLQLSHRRPPEMRRLRTHPRTDVDPPRFLDRTAIGGRHIVSLPPGRYLVKDIF